MALFGDFSSLLQLGVGTGIGLSLFRAPIDLRMSKLLRKVEAELIALKGASTKFGQRKRRDLLDLTLKIDVTREALDRKVLPFMIAAVGGAILNLGSLIFVSVNASRQATDAEGIFFISISVAWFLIEIAALEFVARRALSDIGREFRELRERRAPPIHGPQQSNNSDIRAKKET